LAGEGFFERVWQVVETIPPGKVMTYGQIAAFLDNVCSARYVGYAMSSAPAARKLACHRVINRLGGMSPGPVFGGGEKQRRLLENEGVPFKENGRVDLAACLHRPPSRQQRRHLP
jgi:methylated-DNA-protein-cysteine methyltransferase-like protein